MKTSRKNYAALNGRSSAAEAALNRRSGRIAWDEGQRWLLNCNFSDTQVPPQIQGEDGAKRDSPEC
jgi:hypothetical protein